MRIDRAPQTAPTTPAQAPQRPEQNNSQPAGPAAKGKAHGVVRKLGTDHFNPTAEARLTEKFGYLVPTPEPTPEPEPTPAPVDTPTDGSGTETGGETGVIDGDTQAPVIDEPIVDESTDEPVNEEPTGETNSDATEPAGPITVDLSGVVDNPLTQTLNLVGQSLNVVG